MSRLVRKFLQTRCRRNLTQLQNAKDQINVQKL